MIAKKISFASRQCLPLRTFGGRIPSIKFLGPRHLTNKSLGAYVQESAAAEVATEPVRNMKLAKQGPPLYGILGGRVSGTYDGFAFSEGNKNAAIAWSGKHMFEYLVNPKAYVPGTKMVFAGMKKEAERADVIAFMKT